MLRPALLARYGRDGQLQAEQNAGKASSALSQPPDTGTASFEYRLTLDVEGKAVLEAALGPLSAPQPVEGDATCALPTGAGGTRSSSSSAGRSRPGTRPASPTRRRSW